MTGRFEFFIARRYLKAKRKQAVISVISVISVVGVAAGVMALVVALAINNGFRKTLETSLLGAYAHIIVLEKEPGYGISDWRGQEAKLVKLPHVLAASPALYGQVYLYGDGSPSGAGATLKGIQTGAELETSDMLRHLKAGSLAGLRPNPDALPGILLGSSLAQTLGARLGGTVTAMSPQGELTPFGPRPTSQRFRVVGLFESGFFEIDSTWAYSSLTAAQRLLGLEDVVNSIELKLDDIYKAPEVASRVDGVVGPKLKASTWMEHEPAHPERAQHGARGDLRHHRTDRAGGGAQYSHHADHDGDGEVPRHRDSGFDGREAGADPAHLHVSGRADRRGGHRHRHCWPATCSPTWPIRTTGCVWTKRSTR